MDISFGICVGKNHDPVILYQVLDSIKSQGIPKYQIILIGEGLAQYRDEHTYLLNFDESIKPGWITRKKNLLAKSAIYANVCLLHDYVALDKDWYNGVCRYTEEVNGSWKVLCNRVETLEGTRSADWMVSPIAMDDLILYQPALASELMAAAPHENGPRYVNALPYDVTDLSHVMYVSGGFILCKKTILQNVTFNENMVWGDAPGEDVVWSAELVANGYSMEFNKYSITKILKPNKWHVTEMPLSVVEALREYYGSETVQ